MPAINLTVILFHADKFRLNIVALQNVCPIFVAFPLLQLDMSPLKEEAP